MTVSVQLVQIPAAEAVRQREFYLNEATFNIGRDFASDICLPDLSETISPTHLTITRTTTGGYTATDLSTQGTLLNAKRMPKGEAQPLHDGDIIDFAGYRLLLGIVEQAVPEAPVNFTPDLRFQAETDFSMDDPLMPDAEIEDIPPAPDAGFSDTVPDLDADLMFDPFAEGPELREPIELKRKPDPEAQSPVFSDTVEVMEFGAPEMPDAQSSAVLYREHVSDAIEQALDRFLSELDPNVLQDDYDEYIPFLARRRRRYWKIHRTQFAKKKASGEFKRMFMGLLAEEMRKT
ncbi:MAG: FHA domain-containing protein [Pseudomonadota bacterium]